MYMGDILEKQFLRNFVRVVVPKQLFSYSQNLLHEIGHNHRMIWKSNLKFGLGFIFILHLEVNLYK